MKSQYETIRDVIDRSLLKVVKDGDFILGKEVDLLENEFAQFCETNHAVGVSSGTDALRLALEVCGIGEGDEVITAANTFIATALAISHVGATPVLVDVSKSTYNIDVSAIEQAITPRTRAIIPVHLYGQPADMDPILRLARTHHLKVVEDACQAHGARYKGKRAGSLGDLGCFSFYPSKNLGAYGDGGMIFTNNAEYAEKLQVLRHLGQKAKYVHVIKGSNNRLDTLQAAVLRVKLKHLDEWNAMRRKNAQRYKDLLGPSGFAIPYEESFVEHVYHLFVIEVERRDDLQKFLAENGIQTGIHYPIPIYEQEAYREIGSRGDRYPVTSALSRRIVSLPFFAELTEDQIQYVVQKIRSFYGR